MTDLEFRNFLDSNGRLISERAFRESIYQGGVEPSLRKVTWRHLLNVYPPGTYWYTRSYNRAARCDIITASLLMS